MIIAYLESIKYVGHLWPVAIFRILFGYHYFSMAIHRLQTGYLEHAYISEKLRLSYDQAVATGFYFDIFKSLVQSNWMFFTYLLLTLECLIGISFIIGFAVRFSALIGMILSLHIYLFFEELTAAGQMHLFCIHLLLLALGAGRCLGIDYYFYKSRRGLFW